MSSSGRKIRWGAWGSCPKCTYIEKYLETNLMQLKDLLHLNVIFL